MTGPTSISRRSVRLVLVAATAFVCGCAPHEVKWSILDADQLEPSMRAWAGCVGDTDCVVVVDLRCHAFALNKKQAQAWWSRDIPPGEKESQPKCMPPRGETLYAARCGANGLCVPVPP